MQHVQIITPCISTHAPLARCDRYPAFKTPGVRISTHAPLARCDLRRAADSAAVLLFQLTHLLRGATARARIGGYVTTLFQLTHLLRGATCWWKLLLPPSYFNSRTSCEVRQVAGASGDADGNFNSRTSCEVRRVHCGFPAAGFYFNSRTSCEVRRTPRPASRAAGSYFNSRTSCEVRQMRDVDAVYSGGFQLTHLLRGATHTGA